MAKGAISGRRNNLGSSIHSRAARRATSPSINTDKSLKGIQPPAESVHSRPSVLSIHNGAGVCKKAKKSKSLSFKARRRHEKEQDRAIIVMERMERKIAKSRGQAQTAQARRRAWDEINDHIPAEKRTHREIARSRDNKEVSEAKEEMDSLQVLGDATIVSARHTNQELKETRGEGEQNSMKV
ncbi:Alb1-domain-containing protein [Durotheca rogersii]|uniref:Alb1-domain-containing protein n=1 Tax=Durotheca rogersii TaxID=419775 RepID=UPI00221EE25B|nr:Alb1-domain-containing protein [Durotheca rogersii]KAI5862742.1 Alb1-domain-containing protein [Durotheca rogersii]